MLSFEYAVFGSPDAITPAHALWTENLPGTASGAAGSNILTYGNYFEAVSGMIHSNGAAAFGCPGEAIESPVHISLEKHGALYHPGRISAQISGRSATCVVNVAASGAEETAKAEFDTLHNLYTTTGNPDIPKVHIFDTQPASDNSLIGMFTADWFTGLYEWHLTDLPDNTRGVVIWAEGKNIYPASTDAASIFEQASEILAKLYDIKTGAQVFPWHHAAGDFIVSADTRRVKLITVRQYTPMMDIDESSLESRLMSLVFFILNTSLRIRMDRIDGIGKLAWADETYLAASLKGMSAGFKGRYLTDGVTVSEILSAYTANLDTDDLKDMFGMITASYHPDAPEHELLDQHADSHIQEVLPLLKKIFCE